MPAAFASSPGVSRTKSDPLRVLSASADDRESDGVLPNAGESTGNAPVVGLGGALALGGAALAASKSRRRDIEG